MPTKLKPLKQFLERYWLWILTVSFCVVGIFIYIGCYPKKELKQLPFMTALFLDISRILIGIGLSLIVVNITVEGYQRKLEKNKWKGFESKARDTIIVSLNRWITTIRLALKIEPPPIPEKEKDLKNLEENLVDFVLSKLSNERLNSINYNKAFVENFTRIAQESIFISNVFSGILVPNEMEALIEIYDLGRKVVNCYFLYLDTQDEVVKEYFRNELKLLIGNLLKKIKMLKISLNLRAK